MAAMRRVTMLFPEDLWLDLATAASLRGQSRGEYARDTLRRQCEGSLIMAGMRPDPNEAANEARRQAGMAEAGGTDGQI